MLKFICGVLVGGIIGVVDDVLMKVIEKIEVPSDKVKRGRRSHEER